MNPHRKEAQRKPDLDKARQQFIEGKPAPAGPARKIPSAVKTRRVDLECEIDAWLRARAEERTAKTCCLKHCGPGAATLPDPRISTTRDDHRSDPDARCSDRTRRSRATRHQ